MSFQSVADDLEPLPREDVVANIEALAGHRWVETIEQGQHGCEDTGPLCGPNKPE